MSRRNKKVNYLKRKAETRIKRENRAWDEFYKALKEMRGEDVE